MNKGIRYFALAVLGAPALIAASQGLPRALQAAAPGLWEFSDPEGNKPARRICVRDLTALAQIEHSRRQCTRVVIADEPGATTIHYTCVGGGFGRSTLEQVTPRNFRLDTQGISGGLPFHDRLDARRIGSC